MDTIQGLLALVIALLMMVEIGIRMIFDVLFTFPLATLAFVIITFVSLGYMHGKTETY